MPHGFGAHPSIQPTIELSPWNLVERGEKVLHRLSSSGTSFSGYPIKFAAIARGEDHRFFQYPALAQFIRCVKRLLGCKHHSLAQFERGSVVVAANEGNLNADGALDWRLDLRLH